MTSSFLPNPHDKGYDPERVNKNVAELLDYYCKNALAFLDDTYLVYGSAFAVRSAIELMAAYLRTYQGNSNAHWNGDITTVFKPSGRTGVQNFKDCFSQCDLLMGLNAGNGRLLENLYFAYYGPADKPNLGINYIMHYQDYKSCIFETENDWVEKEIASVQKVFAWLGKVLRSTDEQASSFGTIIDEFFRRVLQLNPEDYPNVSNLSAFAQSGDTVLPHENAVKYDWEESRIRYPGVDRHVIEDYYYTLFSHCGEELKNVMEREYDGKEKRDVTVVFDTLQLHTRRFAERCGALAIKSSKNWDIVQNQKIRGDRTRRECFQGSNVTAVDYYETLDKICLESEKARRHNNGERIEQETTEYATNAIQSIAQHQNLKLHWVDRASVGTYKYEVISGADLDQLRRDWEMLNRFMRRLYHSVIIPEEVPEPIRTFIQDGHREYEELVEETGRMRKKYEERIKAQKKKIMILASCCLVFVVIGVINGLDYWTNRMDHPGDPAPAFSEYAAADAALQEVPSVSVQIDGTELMEGVPAAFAYSADPIQLTVSASDDRDYSAKLGADSRLAYLRSQKNESKDNALGVNTAGLALAKLKYYPCDSEGKKSGQSYDVSYTNATDGVLSVAVDLEPGRYMLCFEAVGAADGKVVDGKEINAATGWLEYPFVLLPESVDFILKNPREGDALVEQGASLRAYIGDKLNVTSNAEVSEPVAQMRWDDAQEWTEVENDTIQVPRLQIGNHILHLRAAFKLLESEFVFSQGKVFSVIVKSAETGAYPASIQLYDGEGNRISTDQPWIVRPRDELTVEAEAPNGIERITFQVKRNDTWGSVEEMENGKLTIDEEFGSSACELRIEAIGNDNFGDDDTFNRAAVQLKVYVYAKEDEYDGDKLTTEWLYDDPTTNQPTRYIEYIYDEEDRLVEQSWWYADGSPAYYDSETARYHSIKTIYNDDGWQEEWIYDLDDVTLSSEDEWAYGASGTAAKRNNAGEVLEYWYYRAPGELMEVSDKVTGGFAGWITEFDYSEDGYTWKQTYYDTNRDPVLVDGGYCVIISAHNAQGQVTDWWMYDVDGKTPCTWNKLFHHAHYEYEGEYRTGEAFYDVNGDLCENPGQGYAKVERKYDSAGNLRSEIFYDEDGPIDMGGYVKWVREYKPQTNYEISCTYYDAEGKPANNIEYGYAICETGYDPVKREKTEVSYRDAQGRPVNCSDGYQTWKRTIETHEDGYTEKWGYYDVNGKSVVPKGMTYATEECVYDNENNLRVRRYLDAQGNLVSLGEGDETAYIEYYYNGSRFVKEIHYSMSQKPCLIDPYVNYCGWVVEAFDERTEYRYYLNESLERIPNELGVYYVKLTRDSAGNEIREDRYTLDNVYPAGDAVRYIEWEYYEPEEPGDPLVKRIERQYTESTITEFQYAGDSRITARSFYNLSGERITDEYGVWKYTEQSEEVSDELGNQRMIETSCCYDVNEHLIVGPDGYATYYRETTAATSLEEYRGADGKLLPMGDNAYARIVKTYKGGELTSQAYYGVDEQPVLNEYGIAEER